METTIKYNGIEIKNVLTNYINQDVVKEPTGVDPLFVKVEVSCTGIVTALASKGATVTIGVNVGPEITSGYNAIIDNLMQPRRQFVMNMGGAPILNVVAGAVRPGLTTPKKPLQNTDVNNGPVTSVRIIEVISAHTFKIEFNAVLSLPYCDTPGASSNNILSFRFWVADDIDCTNWTTERVYQGRIRVAHHGVNVHQELRDNFTFPGLTAGMVRRSISLKQSNDGLWLDFLVKDKELQSVPPQPATDWDGHYKSYSPVQGGLRWEAECFVMMKGPKNVPKLKLYELCQKVLDAKLHLVDLRSFGNTILMYIEYSESLRDNEVSGFARIQFTLPPTEVTTANAPKVNWGTHVGEGPRGIPGYDKDKSYVANPTADIQSVVASFLNDPCHVTIPFEGESPNPAQKKPKTAQPIGQSPGEDTDPIIEQWDPQYTQEHTEQGMYTTYRMSSDIELDKGSIHLPIGKSGTGTSNSVVLSIHNPIAERIIRIEAERLNKWPQVPKDSKFTDSLGIVHTPIDVKISPSLPVLSAEGKKTLYHVIYEIRYAIDKLPDNGEIPAGLLPYRTSGNAAVKAIPSDAFESPSKFFGGQDRGGVTR